MLFSPTLRIGWLLAGLVIAISGCANRNDRYKQPPPRDTQPLPSAHGSVYGKAAGTPTSLSDRCITSAGHCPLPAAVQTGLPCTCDSKNPEFSYGGRTGPIPPMPDWADPRLKHTN